MPYSAAEREKKHDKPSEDGMPQLTKYRRIDGLGDISSTVLEVSKTDMQRE